MTYGVYSFRDNKTSFGQIWYDRSDDAAKRGFSVMIGNDVMMRQFSSDFDLFKIAEFDSETGQIDPVWPIEYLCNGNAVIMEKDYEK